MGVLAPAPPRPPRSLLGRAALGLLALVVGLAAVISIGLLASLSQNPDTAVQPSYGPSATAIADIPNAYLVLYLRAGSSEGIDWSILAAIGKIETDHGRSNAKGVKSGVNAYGCCAGPMQFSITGSPSTWDGYGVDGNGDGHKSPYDPADAIPAAAAYLKASGAPEDYRKAIFSYNHAGWYVAEVLAQAQKYRGALRNAAALPADVIVNQRSAGDVLRLAAGAHPRIGLSAIQVNDLRTGQIDPRVTSLLVATVGLGHTITVTALKGDHGFFTTSGYPSNHAFGRAVDIGIVDGEACDSDAHGRSGRCWRLGREFTAIRGDAHPDELIYGIDLDGPTGPAFAMDDHKNHLHAGYGPR